MKRHYARVDQEQRLFELEREPTMAHEWVYGWTCDARQSDRRGVRVALNPRYIRFFWIQDDQEEIAA